MLVCGFVLWGMPHLTMAIGDVKVEREGVVQSVVAGFELQENDVVITGPFSKAIIELDNGGKISLDENTRLAVETLNGSDSVFDVHRGRILAKLVKKKGLRFKFKTPVGVAGVRGTELAISVDEKSSKVYVFNGLVDFKTIKGGDNIVLSIACASIIAKVYRDNLMLELHQQYPLYGFDSNKGYPTRKHRQALIEYGATPCHRQSFAPVRNVMNRV